MGFWILWVIQLTDLILCHHLFECVVMPVQQCSEDAVLSWFKDEVLRRLLSQLVFSSKVYTEKPAYVARTNLIIWWRVWETMALSKNTKIQPFCKSLKNIQYLFNILSTTMPLFICYFKGSVGLWFNAFKLE